MVEGGLSEKKLKAIEMLLNNETKTHTGEVVGVDRRTINNWCKDKEFIAEMDRQRSQMKKRIEDRITMQLDPLTQRLFDIALSKDNDANSIKAISYLLDRVLGKATTKVEQTINDNTDSNNVEDINDLISKAKSNLKLVK